MSLRRLVLAGSLLAASGCSSGPTETEPSLLELRTAPTTLVVGGRAVPVSAEIWRNLMPSIGPAGSPLAAFIRFPQDAPSLAVTRIWVLLGEDSWSGPASLTVDSQTWMARNGPEWALGSQAEVVARLRLVGGRLRLVRVPAVTIQGAF